MQESVVGARGERVPIDPPDMRQSIAWHLALAAVKKQEAAEAEELLRSETGCEMVREVQVGAYLWHGRYASELCISHLEWEVKAA